MIPLDECTQCLNATKGKRKYRDVEVRVIREALTRLAELEYLNNQINSFTNNKKEEK
jgi:hypothetical protein